MNMLTITNLRKRFGDKEVLKGVSLTVPEGSVYGFIGRNGAGKTTTMKTVLGLQAADEGEIMVAGERVVYGANATNRHIGYLPDVPEFYPYMTAPEYLRFCGEVTGMEAQDIRSRSEELLALVGLAGERHRIRGYSRGMKQRLGIAQALLNRPKLLICDEPTSALDPVGRKEILDILQAAREQTTVLFSTHILSDVERICSDVAFLHDGQIVTEGPLAEIRARHMTAEFAVEMRHAEDVPCLIEACGGIADGEHRVLFKDSEGTMHAVMGYLAEQRMEIERLERRSPSLESLFLDVVSPSVEQGADKAVKR